MKWNKIEPQNVAFEAMLGCSIILRVAIFQLYIGFYEMFGNAMWWEQWEEILCKNAEKL